jgi:ARG/rhodanese/phosphatase superfamily protein
MHTNPLAAALDSVTLGPEVIVQNLTMIPLVLKQQPRGTFSTLGTPGTVGTSPEYFVLDDALSSGLVEITEVSDQGSVPNLRVANRAAQPVLIVDGEELLGAKQNRIVNLTILVAAKSDLTIPVSCVEAGRWRMRSRAFTAAPRTQYATGRAKRMAHVSYSMLSTGDRVSDQADVWHDIAQKSSRLNATSPTSAMDAIFSTHSASVETFVSGCAAVDGQVGALFAVGDAIVGFDLFDRPSTLRKMLPKLVRSVAIDAIDAAAGSPSKQARRVGQAEDGALRARAAQFLAVTAEAPRRAIPAIGIGDDVRLTAPHIAGAALVLDDHVIHLGAFAL